MKKTLFARNVNFREFYFSIREFQISRLVKYSKLTRHSAWTTHLIRECCNTVGLDITPRGCCWAAAPGKWSDGREAVVVSNYKARLMYSLRVDLPPAPLTHWELITIQWTYSVTDSQLAQATSRWIRVSTVVKRLSVVSPAVYHTSRQREIQCSIPRNFFFESRVSRVSLASLLFAQHYFSFLSKARTLCGR